MSYYTLFRSQSHPLSYFLHNHRFNRLRPGWALMTNGLIQINIPNPYAYSVNEKNLQQINDTIAKVDRLSDRLTHLSQQLF